MAPTRPRQPNLSVDSRDGSALPAPSHTHSVIDRSPTKTPMRSSIKKARKGITLKQKQALIDNLRLEIAERARKLRAQEALQCRGLRTRVEIRINRVPSAMRKPKMRDLLAKHMTQQNASKSTAILPGMVPKTASTATTVRQIASAPLLAQKRKSDESFSDDENNDVSNPKKRSKPSPEQAAGGSRGKEPVKALSPRSANTSSRPTTATSTNSPIRPPQSKMAPPTKSYLARPAAATKALSPIKPQGGAATMLNSLVTKAKASRSASTRKITPAAASSTAAASRVRKQTAVPPPVPRATRARASNTSESSANSQGTTIVRKPVPISQTAPAKKEPVKRELVKKAAAAKGSVRGTTTARKPSASAAAKAAAKSVVSAAGRSLRSKRA